MLEHEIKYLVPSSNAPALIAWISSTCIRDSKYPPAAVHTVYYDTPRLSLLHEKIDSDFLKTKVRIRWYADASGRPADAVFAEVKYRVGSQRHKVRVRLGITGTEAAARPLHDRAWIDWLAPVRADVATLPATLAPVLALRYTRHRFDAPARTGRITVDEGIAVDEVNRGRIHGRIPGWFPDAVFEYKGPQADPPASLAPVVRFGGRRGSYSKYLACYQHVTRVIF